MAEAATSHASVSVASFRIAEFAGRPVSDQLDLRERLESALDSALALVPPADRIVLDAADGAIVVFLDSAEAALRFASAVRERARALSLPLRIGLNSGPIAPAPGPAGEPNVVGDGVSAAAAVAGLAGRRGLAASRAFRDALARGNADLAAVLRPAGERTDERLRTHELFTCRSVPRDLGRRRLIRAIAVSTTVILASGIAVRVVRRQVTARSKPAVVVLEITPWAEVVVDGAPRGRTPPMKTLELAPGEHTIEIRHPGVRPIIVEVDLKAGEETSIRHAFGSPQQPSKLRNLMRKFGL